MVFVLSAKKDGVERRDSGRSLRTIQGLDPSHLID